jgi:hypothetical protein
MHNSDTKQYFKEKLLNSVQVKTNQHYQIIYVQHEIVLFGSSNCENVIAYKVFQRTLTMLNEQKQPEFNSAKQLSLIKNQPH